MPAQRDSSAAAPEPRRRLLRAATLLVGLQALALIGLGLVLFAELARRTATNPPGAWFGAAIAIVVGLGLGAAARGLRQGRRWARAPVLVVQLLLLAVAAGPGGVVAAGRWDVGLPLIAWGLAVAVLLFVPAVAAELED